MSINTIMNKCTVVIMGLVLSLSVFAFFAPMMQMPQQAMQMMMPQQQPCDCECKPK